jgi:hypothetical protein
LELQLVQQVRLTQEAQIFLFHLLLEEQVARQLLTPQLHQVQIQEATAHLL